MKPRRKKITGVPDGKPLTHAMLKQIHDGLHMANEEFSKLMAKKLFGRLADEPEVKKFMKDHFIIEAVPVTLECNRQFSRMRDHYGPASEHLFEKDSPTPVDKGERV